MALPQKNPLKVVQEVDKPFDSFGTAKNTVKFLFLSYYSRFYHASISPFLFFSPSGIRPVSLASRNMSHLFK